MSNFFIKYRPYLVALVLIAAIVFGEEAPDIPEWFNI